MNLPSTRECFYLIREMGMMDHIIDHSVMVSNVAVCIARSIRQTDPELNIHLVLTASLLHDITKTRSFETGESHSETGGVLLRNKGYPEIAEIIRQHVMLDRCRKEERISEPEIVNYADKRVLHDRVVSLEERLNYIQDRYGSHPKFSQKIPVMWEKTLVLEEKLFRRMTFSPDELAGRIVPEVARTGAASQSTM